MLERRLLSACPFIVPARHIFGSGGDTPNVLAAAGRLATAAARGSAPPPEPGLLASLRRDRERRISVTIDRLSFVVSPNGFLTAARAATAFECAVSEAAAASRLSPGVDEYDDAPAHGKRPMSGVDRNDAPAGGTRPISGVDRDDAPAGGRRPIYGADRYDAPAGVKSPMPGVHPYGAPANGGKRTMCVVRAAARPLAPLLLRPSVSTSLQVQIGEFRSLLSLESRPLASLSLSGLSFEASRSEWWDVSDINDDAFQASGWRDATRGAWISSTTPGGAWVGTSTTPGDNDRQSSTRRQGAGTARERSMPLAGWPGWTWTGGRRRADLGFLRVCLQGLGVLDLTTDGQLHAEVVSHAKSRGGVAESGGYASSGTPSSAPPRRSSSSRSSRGQEAGSRSGGKAAGPGVAVADQAPVVVVELIPASSGGGRGGEVKASVSGLRVCFLLRFMAEVIKYFGPDGLGPVFEVVRHIGCGNVDDDDAGRGDTEHQEGKKSAVGAGKEDTAVPDAFSEGSSVDRRRSGSRRNRARTPAASPVKQQTEIPATPASQSRSGSNAAGAEAAMRVTAVLRDLTVVIPRNTHSREAVAAKCQELVIEVRRAMVPLLCLILRHILEDSFVHVLRLFRRSQLSLSRGHFRKKKIQQGLFSVFACATRAVPLDETWGPGCLRPKLMSGQMWVRGTFFFLRSFFSHNYFYFRHVSCEIGQFNGQHSSLQAA